MQRDTRIPQPAIRNAFGRIDAAAQANSARRRPSAAQQQRQPASRTAHDPSAACEPRRPPAARTTRRPSDAYMPRPLPKSAYSPPMGLYRMGGRVASDRSAATALIALALVAAVGFAAWFTFQASQGTLPAADATANHASGAMQSTPQSEWKKGSFPYLYQKDPQWSGVRYAENNFGESGCGPTCMAMVYAGLTGATDKDPASMAALATSQGFAEPEGTAWLFMSEGAASLGLNATEVPADEQSMRRELAAGRPIICSMGPGDFTTTGHFIVIVDIDSNSKLVVRDPNSPERSAVSWDFDTILKQCRAMWSYSLV